MAGASSVWHFLHCRRPPSHLGDRLLQLWAWCVLSATNVQWLAEGSILDGGDHEQLKQLAKIGSHGSYPGNCRRDLLVMVHRTHAGVQPLPLELPVIEGDRLVLRRYAMMSPVRLCDYIVKRVPAVFRQLFGVDDLDTFWMQVRPDDPKLQGHPMLLRRGWQRRAIPIVVHGDGGRFTNNNKNSLMVVSWRPLLNPRIGIGTFFAVVFHCLCCHSHR